MRCAWNALVRILPPWLGQEINPIYKDVLQELRLRKEKPPELICRSGSSWLKTPVTQEDLHFCVNTASKYSPWAAQSMAKGYLTAPGGHRIGICGEGIWKAGENTGIKNISSLCIRVARDFPGIGAALAPLDGSILILGSPGCGKTYIIEAFIHELMKQGYSFMKLAGADIHASLVGEAEKRVERAFQEARRHAPCILFIDEIDSVCRNRSTPNLPNHALNTTNAFLNAYNEMVSDDKPVIFIGATNYPHMVDVAMADRAEMVRVPLPDLPAKANKFRMLFEKTVKNEDGTTRTETKIALEPGFTYMDMADEIDNYSYRDFDRLQKCLVDALLAELRASYGQSAEAGEEMYRAVSTGEHPLTRELYMKVLSSFQPSKKDEIIRSLDSWDADIQKKMAG